MRRPPRNPRPLWILLCLPFVPSPALAGDADRDEYVWRFTPTAEHAALLDELIDDGFSRRVSLDEMNRRFAQALRESNDDPAVRYAYALSLARRNDYDEALQELERARGTDAEPYLPAWKGSIWILMNRGRYDDGFALLREFAALQERAGVTWPSEVAPLENCRWIGRLLAGLDLDSIGLRERAMHLETYVDIEESFRPECRNAMHFGVRDALKTYRELAESLEELRGATREQQAEQRETVTQELVGKQEEVNQEKEKLKLTAEEWKKKYDDAMIEFGKQIGEAQRDYGLLDARRQSLARSITALRQRIMALNAEYSITSTQAQFGNMGGTFFIGSPGAANPAQASILSDIDARERQLNEYQGQYNQTVGELNQVRNEGLTLLQQRANLIAEYQRATGVLVKQDKKLDGLSKKFSRDVEELNDGPPNGQSRETRTIQRQMKSFQTYVVFDLDGERQRLVDAHSPAVETTE